jgi:histidyl-tRNA synthetase
VFSYNRQGVGKQFKQAAQRGARHVVIVESGPAEERLTVKDMATGSQREIDREALLRDTERLGG